MTEDRPTLYPPARHTLRTFALVFVSITTIFVIGMGIWLVSILADKGWCSRALGAAKYAGGSPETAIGGCYQLLTAQLHALAINSFIYGGVVALCLAALMLIVVAGGRLSFRGGKDGVEAEIGKDRGPPSEGGNQTKGDRNG